MRRPRQRQNGTARADVLPAIGGVFALFLLLFCVSGFLAGGFSSAFGTGQWLWLGLLSLLSAMALFSLFRRMRKQTPQEQPERMMPVSIFEDFLDTMDSYLCVTYLDTDELIFLDRKMVETFGLEEGYRGKRCYEALYGLDHRCEGCPLPVLEETPDAVISWERENHQSGLWLQSTDWTMEWLNGRRIHLQRSIDLTEAKKTEARLLRQLKQQELMAAMSQSFISNEDSHTLISKALEMAGEFMNASKVIIAAVETEEGPSGRQYFLTRRFGWFNKSHGIEALGDMSRLPLPPGHPIYEAFIEGKEAFVSCADTAIAPAFDYLRRFDVQSFITAPLYLSDEFWGIITVDDCLTTRQWDRGEVHLVNLIGGVIGELILSDKMEEQLMLMSSIVDSSPLCIAYIGEGGVLEYVNQGGLDIAGYTQEEMMERGLAAPFGPDFQAEIFARAYAEGAQGARQTFEWTMTCKNGEHREMLISVFSISQDVRDVGLIASDITEKRQLERELIAARDQAERSSHAKTDFLSRMSHEMRTPMNAIIGMTSIANKTQDPERKDYCLGKIGEASSHLLGVINDILDMSKIEANKFELSNTDFLFERMLIKTTNIIAFRVDEKEQTLFCKIDRDVPSAIIADEQRLSQVITNLLSNAVKFTPEGGKITLSAHLVEEQDDLCTLQIEVQDTGIGISKEQQSRLFRPFEQADGGISRRFGGTGLGLVISKSIVEMMGGEIRVESELGAGTTMIFTIKAKKGSAQPLRPPGQSPQWNDLRLLVVDDSIEVLEYFRSIADSLGLHCEVASGGYEASSMLARCEKQDESFHIVFVDWKMPGMDGIELTRHIKDLYGESTIVIMISAAEWSQIEVDATAAGVDRFIPKPLFASVIADCINECLGVPDDAHTQEDEAFAGHFDGNCILLAEDIEINREILITLLAATGVVIDCAENGREAFEMFQKAPERYDMIFMDIHMPEVDGYESTRMIRELDLPEAGTIPIVAMTANVFREDIEKCLAAGMNDHVGKPLDMDDVLDKLRKYLPLQDGKEVTL